MCDSNCVFVFSYICFGTLLVNKSTFKRVTKNTTNCFIGQIVCHINLLITTVADNIFIFVFHKIWLYISCESSARQMIHMKCQVLFSQKKCYFYLFILFFLYLFFATVLPQVLLQGLKSWVHVCVYVNAWTCISRP